MQDLVRIKKLGIEREGLSVIEDLNLVLREDEVLGIMGPSGVGKTSLLRCLVAPGEVTWMESEQLLFAGKARKERDISVGYVPQSGGLFPWATVLQNLELSQIPSGETDIPALAKALFPRLCLPLRILGKYPDEISGGERKRASIARALVGRPDLLLLDEPLGNLDPGIRLQCQELLGEYFRSIKGVLLVTHDIEEVIYLCDRVVVISGEPARIQLELRVPAARPRKHSFRDSEECRDLVRELRLLLLASDEGDSRTHPSLIPGGGRVTSSTSSMGEEAVEKRRAH